MTALLIEIQRLLQQHFELSTDQIRPDQTLTELGIDSLSAIEFMFALEDKFKISLSDERGELGTVADVVSLVERAVAAKGQAA